MTASLGSGKFDWKSQDVGRRLVIRTEINLAHHFDHIFERRVEKIMHSRLLFLSLSLSLSLSVMRATFMFSFIGHNFYV